MSQSAERTTHVRRKRSLSALVGKESLQAQENITSDVITRLVKRKGSNFRLRLAKGGGQSGMGAEVTVGAGKTEHNVLPIEVFKEKKKDLIKSRKKMESLCHRRGCNRSNSKEEGQEECQTH